VKRQRKRNVCHTESISANDDWELCDDDIIEGANPKCPLNKTAPKIREYQEEAVDALSDSTATFIEDKDFVQVVLPTGAGKTLVGNEYIRRHLNDNPDAVVLWMAPYWALLAQACDSLTSLVPTLQPELRRIGGDNNILSHLQTNEGGLVYYSTTHTLRARIKNNSFEHLNFSVLIYDESHWGINAKMAREIYHYFRDRRVPLVGLTATPVQFRSNPDKPHIDYRRTYQDLMVQGYLAEPVVVRIETGQRWAPTFVNGQNFTQDSLKELDNEERNNLIADTLKVIVKKRPNAKVLVFACNITHADTLAELFGKHTIACRSVHSAVNDQAERNQWIKDFRQGKLQVLVNVGMLTHGFDVPEIDTILLARPSESDVLCAQMIGRGARRTPGKNQFEIYDFHDSIQGNAEKVFSDPRALFREKKDDLSIDWARSYVHTAPAPGPSYPHFEVLEGPEFSDLQGIRFVSDQKFGIEIEFALLGHDEIPDFGDPYWQEKAQNILTVLSDALGPSHVLLKPHEYHETPTEDKKNRWHLEHDNSAGWEVVSPILEGHDGFSQVLRACQALDGFLEDSEIGVDHRCGLHITLATRLEKTEQLIGFIERVQRLEPGLFTLVAPSRLFSFDGRNYHTNIYNRYCLPSRHIDLNRLKNYSLNVLAPEDEYEWGDEFIDEYVDRDHTVNVQKWPWGNLLVEVRMHNGTTDHRKVIPWISLWMKIFNYSAYNWQGPRVDTRKVFGTDNGGTPKIDDQDIIYLLEQEGIEISSVMKRWIFQRRKMHSHRWRCALPRRVQKWRRAGWYDETKYGLDEFKAVTKHPTDCNDSEITSFVSMVREGGQVSEVGLDRRVRRSYLLAFAWSGNRIIGVGALKNPDESYATSVFNNAGLGGAWADYPLELGWVYVNHEFRQQGVGATIVSRLLDQRGGQGVYTTHRSDNTGMEEIIKTAEFKMVGSEYKSSIEDAAVRLYVMK
jgi:superfamily II DNA or RNA helicase/GNAT superfamily N-acetyltransferase